MRWRGYAYAAVTLGVIVAALRLASVGNAGIAAPLLLLAVVVVARFWRTGPALFAAALGAALYSYYFLPPAGFAIEDPDDWVAFVTFIVTAVVAGELASRAEHRAVEAQEGRREIERLYHELQAAFDRASEAEAARRTEQTKAALLEALTHNLRTPLTAIKAGVTALTGAAAPRSITEQRELLQVIDEESDRLNRFIEGLSTAGGSEVPQPAHMRAVPLDAIIVTAVQRASSLVRDHHVRLSVSRDVPLLSVDAASVTEVLYILLDNASKYSPPGSTIELSAAVADDHFVRVAVTDHGPGIPEALRTKVFDKFFRVPGRESHDHRRGGAGLGLSIAKRLVEAQAGQIWIEAAAGGGTSVQMRLPVAASREEGTAEPAVEVVAAE